MALSKENTMAKNAHLVLDERATIEVRLRERASFTEIGRELGKDPSTISKEVRLHSQTVRKDSFNPCSKRSTCDECGTACSKCKLQYSKSCKRCPRVKCYEHCKQFEVLVCNKLKNHHTFATAVSNGNPVSWRSIFILPNQLRRIMRLLAQKVVKE